MPNLFPKLITKILGLLLISASFLLLPLFSAQAAIGFSVGNSSLNLGQSENLFYGTIATTSHASSSFLLFQRGGVDRFKIDGYGNVNTTGTITAAAFSGPITVGSISAGNVSSGAFGSLVGNGNYSFPASLGIGTTDPKAPLEINSSSAPRVYIHNSISAAGTANLDFAITALTDGFTTGRVGLIRNADSTQDMAFSTFNSSSLVERMRILGGGNIGIGVTNPVNTLDIRGGSYPFAAQGSSGKGFVLGDNTNYADVIGLNNAHGAYNDINFRTSATAGQLYLKADGNVGVGTTVPNSKLHVNGSLETTSSSISNHYYNVLSYYTGTGSAVGTLKIVTPKAWSNTMLHITIKGYNYDAKGAWTATVGGYNYQTGYWLNYSAKIDGPAPFSKVRLAYDGSKSIILLGDVSTSWSYATIEVTDVVAAFNGLDGWGSGWSASLITDETGISAISTASIYTFIDAIGNLGVGTTNPTARLSVSNGTGNVIYSGGGQINGLPAVQTEDTQAVSRRYLHDNFSASSTSFWGGSLGSKIWNMNLGNVGIGTTDPGSLLTVSKGIIANIEGGAALDSTLLIRQNTNGTGASAIEFGFGGGTGNFLGSRIVSNIVSGGGANMYFQTATSSSGTYTSKMTILRDGNIGVGIASPGSKLDVAEGILKLSGTTGYSHGVLIERGPAIVTTATQASIFNEWNGLNSAESLTARAYSYKLQNTDGTNWLTIKNGGNIGIGTIAPGEGNLLNVKGPTPAGTLGFRDAARYTGQIYIESNDAYTTQKGGRIAFGGVAGANGGAFAGYTRQDSVFGTIEGFKANASPDNAGGGLIFSTNLNSNGLLYERMRILDNGNVAIGATTSALKLVVSNGTGNVINSAGGQINGLPAVQTEDSQAVSRKYLHDNFSSTSSASATSLWSGTKNGNIWNGDAGVGNVGIGTTTPLTGLHISKNTSNYQSAGTNLIIESTNGNPGITFVDSGDSTWLLRGQDSANNDLYLWRNTGTGASPSWGSVVTFNRSTGNVGIGATNPEQELEVVDNNNNAYTFSLYRPQNGGNFGVIQEFALNNSNNVRVSYADMYGGIFGSGSTAGSENGMLVFRTKRAGTMVEAFRVDNSGNVGIGVTNPAYKLEISNGSINIPSSVTTSTIAYYINTNNVMAQGGAGYNNSSLVFNKAGLANVIIANGNVGIGNVNPSVKLTMATSTGNLISTAGGQIIGLPAVQTEDTQAVSRKYLHDNFSSTSSITATSFWTGSLAGNISNANTGNIGIGTTSPLAKLDIKTGTAPFTALKISNYSSNANALYSGAVDDTSIFLGTGYYYNGGLYRTPGTAASIVRFEGGALKFFTDSGLTANTDYTPTERMRIMPGGNVGVGISNAGYKLDVNGNIGTNYGSLILNPNGGTISTDGTYGVYWHQNAGVPDSSYGIYRTAGAWTPSTYQQLKMSFTTGIIIDGGSSYTKSGTIIQPNGGNVGIGITNPETKLHILDAVGDPSTTYATNITSAGFKLGASGTGTGLLTGIGADASYAWLQIQNTDSSEKNLILNPVGGNVGINTTTPSLKFVVSNGTGNVINSAGGQINGLPAVQTEDTQAVSRKYLHDNFSSSSTASTTSLWSGAKNGNIWNGDAGVGRVGIGTTTPGTKLHISSTNAAFNNTGALAIYSTSGDGADLGGQISLGGNNSLYGNLNYANIAGRKESSATIAADGYLQFSTLSSAGGNMLERMRITSTGNVGIGTTAPIGKLQIGANTLSGANGVYDNSRIGTMVNGTLTSMVYASNYNSPTYPDYGLVFLHASSTIDYNVWSISPDGPAKGNGLNFIYQANATNIHTQTPKVVFKGDGRVGIGTTNPVSLLEIENTGGSPLTLSRDDTTLTVGEVLGALQFYGNDASTDTTGYTGVRAKVSAYENGLNGFGGSTSLGFFTSSGDAANLAERITINHIGNVGVNTTTPALKFVVSNGTGNVINSAGGQINGLPAVQTEDSQAVSRKYLHDNFSSTSSASATSLWSGTKNGNIWNGDAGVGRVGIGTNSPSAKLHVVSDINIPGLEVKNTTSVAGVYNLLKLGGDDWGAANRGLHFQGWTDLGSSYQYMLYNGYATGTTPTFYQGYYERFSGIEFKGGDTNFLVNTGATGSGANTLITPTRALTIQYTGNVGIGTTNPLGKLHVAGTSDWQGTIRVDSNGTSYASYGWYRNGTKKWSLYSNDVADVDTLNFANATGAISMSFQQNSNVGIGTTNPAVKLQVAGSFVSNYSAINLSPNGDFETGTLDGFTGFTSIESTDRHDGKYSAGAETMNSGGFGTEFIPVDPDGYFYLEGWFKSVGASGLSVIYFGTAAYDYNKNALLGNGGSYGYCAAAATSVPNTWTKYTCTLHGEGTNTYQFPVGTRFIKPLFLFNYQTGTGYKVLVDGVKYVSARADEITQAGNLAIFSRTGQGNVGIGISNPAAKLAVSGGTGNVINSGNGQINGLPAVQTEDTQAISRKYLHDNFTSTSTSLWSGTKNGNIWNGDSGSGKVGIGTTNPAELLNILVGTTTVNAVAGLRIGGPNNYATLELGIPEGGGYDGMIRTYGSDLRLYAGHWRTTGASATENHVMKFYTSKSGSTDWNTPKMILNQDGNLGIGLTNPANTLSVKGASGVRITNGSYDANLVFGATDSWKSGIRVWDNGDAEMRIWHANTAGQIVLATGYNGDATTTMPTDGVFIDQNKVGIGYASPSASTGKLIVNGNVGIGITNPGTKLEISNQAVFSTTTPGLGLYGLHFSGQNTSDYANGITWNGGSSGAQAGIYVQGSGAYGTKMYFATTDVYAVGAKTKMMINYDGNVGINTTTPVLKFVVSNGTGNVINSAGGQINGLPAVQTEDSQAVSRKYLHDNFATGVALWSGTKNGNIWNGDAGIGKVGIGTTNPVTKLQVVGGLALNHTNVADANYTVLDSDYIIGYTSLTTNRTVTLPNALCTPGRFFVVLDESGQAGVSKTIIIDPEGATPIIGSPTLNLSGAYNSVYVFCGNSAWFIL